MIITAKAKTFVTVRKVLLENQAIYFGAEVEDNVSVEADKEVESSLEDL